MAQKINLKGNKKPLGLIIGLIALILVAMAAIVVSGMLANGSSIIPDASEASSSTPPPGPSGVSCTSATKGYCDPKAKPKRCTKLDKNLKSYDWRNDCNNCGCPSTKKYCLSSGSCSASKPI